jgi:phosphoserine phosphatase RsbU/P
MLIGMASLYITPRYGLFSIVTMLVFHITSLILCHHKIIPLINILSHNNYNINLQLSISSTAVLTITGYSIHKVIHSIFKKLQNAKDQVDKSLIDMERANNTLKINEKIHKRDLVMAKNVQSAFLISNPPNSDIYDIALLFKPMSEVSGDFYDFYYDNNTIEGVGIFDISGHGISSGLLTIIAKAIIYQNFMKYKKNGLTSIIENANKELINEIKSDHYLTGIMLHFNGDEIEYLNAAHPTALHKNKKQSKVKTINNSETNGTFLGIDLLKNSFSSHKINLDKGDSLLLFTDCLDESRNPEDKEFGLKGIINAFENAPDNSAEETLNFIVKEFYNYTQKENQLNDDLTIILIQKKIH